MKYADYITITGEKKLKGVEEEEQQHLSFEIAVKHLGLCPSDKGHELMALMLHQVIISQSNSCGRFAVQRRE